jgi:histidinol-phosphatase (PHP family)
MIVDYHMHLRGPSEGREGPVELSVEAVERFVEQAHARGVDEIAFTEHMYYFRQAEPFLDHPYHVGRVAHDLDDYCDAILEAKSRGLPVKLALELEWLPGRDGELAETLRPYPWDFLLGSVHLVDGAAVDMESEPGLWDRLSVADVWRRYFAELGALARSGLADVLAHPDLVKIFGSRPGREVEEECHEEAAAAIAEGGVAVEVSTAGLRKPVGELYPDPGFLARCRARGVGATLASDAHVAGDVGRDFDAGLELLRSTGYETVTVFDGRAARQEPLG